jgi:hypothetical protein
MATGQLPDAYGMRLQPPPPRATSCESNDAWDHRDRACSVRSDRPGSVRTPRLGSCAGSYREWTVNLFRSAESSDPFTRG